MLFTSIYLPIFFPLKNTLAALTLLKKKQSKAKLNKTLLPKGHNVVSETVILHREREENA